MTEGGSQLDNERQKIYYRRILHFIGPAAGYVFVINHRPYALTKKMELGQTTEYSFEEILQLPEPGEIAQNTQYSEDVLLEMLANDEAQAMDPESGHQYLAQRLGAEKLQVGDVITVTATGTKRRVVEILGSLGGIRTEKIISTPEGEIVQPEAKPWDMNSVVTGLRSGKITVERVKKPVAVS